MHPNIELYAGIWGWSTKLPTNPTGEFDLYGGIRPTIGPVAFDFGFMYYWYPRETQQWFGNAALTTLTTTRPSSAPFTLADTDFWEFYGKVDLDGERLARDRPLRLLRPELAELRREGHLRGRHRQGDAAVGLVPDRLGRVCLG